MSASEKLKALAEKPVLNMFKINDALPQLLAVVEAAEWTSESGVYSYERHKALTSTLAALEEELS